MKNQFLYLLHIYVYIGGQRAVDVKTKVSNGKKISKIIPIVK